MRASVKLTRIMKDLEWYLGDTYRNSYQPSIMTKTRMNFPNKEITTIIPETGVENSNTDAEMT